MGQICLRIKQGLEKKKRGESPLVSYRGPVFAVTAARFFETPACRSIDRALR